MRHLFPLAALACPLFLATPASAQVDKTNWIVDFPPGGAHAVEGRARVIDDQTIELTNFSYDGTAPSVYVYLALSDDQAGFVSGIECQPILDREFIDETVMISLPMGESMDDWAAISIWCSAFDVNFDSGTFAAVSASASSRNAGTNPQSYSAGAPVLGATWNVSVDLTTTGHSFATVIGMGMSTSLVLNGGQTLLVNGPTYFQLPTTAGPNASWSPMLPNDASLAGVPVYTQAAHLFGVTPFALSNAQDLVVGF